MKREQKITSSIYRQIAIDIANDIVNGKYVEDQTLYGRSVLSSYYKVSPETIRRAIFLLKDVGILDTEKGSGIKIKSLSKARDFIVRQNEAQSVANVKNEVLRWAQRQIEETAEIIDKIKFITATTDRLNNYNPLAPFEVRITHDSVAIGKTADEVHFWHNTGGTIIAIQRGEKLILSPGPYAMFNEDDIVYIVGNDKTYAATQQLLFG